MKRIFKALLTAGAVFIGIQVLCFAVVVSLKSNPTSSEAVVIFRGAEKRIEACYALAAEGLAPVIGRNMGVGSQLNESFGI